MTKPTITGPEYQLFEAFADIIRLATSEPETMNEANERLWAIQDKAAQAVVDELA
jgi:hypothetical protein